MWADPLGSRSRLGTWRLDIFLVGVPGGVTYNPPGGCGLGDVADDPGDMGEIGLLLVSCDICADLEIRGNSTIDEDVEHGARLPCPHEASSARTRCRSV